MMKFQSTATAALIFATGAVFAAGQEPDHRSAQANSASSAPIKPAAMQVAQADAAATQAEVRKVDKDNKKITLKHGEIKNLGMPGMTMVFQVKDPAMLDQVKSGDKVRFTADKIDSGFVVTSIEMDK